MRLTGANRSQKRRTMSAGKVGFDKNVCSAILKLDSSLQETRLGYLAALCGRGTLFLLMKSFICVQRKKGEPNEANSESVATPTIRWFGAWHFAGNFVRSR